MWSGPYHKAAHPLRDEAASRKTGISEEVFIKLWDEFSIFIAGYALMCLQRR